MTFSCLPRQRGNNPLVKLQRRNNRLPLPGRKDVLHHLFCFKLSSDPLPAWCDSQANRALPSASKGLRAFVPPSFSRWSVPVQEAPLLTFLHPGCDQRANPERENSLPSAGKPWSHPRHKARLRLRLPSCESSPSRVWEAIQEDSSVSSGGPPPPDSTAEGGAAPEPQPPRVGVRDHQSATLGRGWGWKSLQRGCGTPASRSEPPCECCHCGLFCVVRQKSHQGGQRVFRQPWVF